MTGPGTVYGRDLAQYGQILRWGGYLIPRYSLFLEFKPSLDTFYCVLCLLLARVCRGYANAPEFGFLWECARFTSSML